MALPNPTEIQAEKQVNIIFVLFVNFWILAKQFSQDPSIYTYLKNSANFYFSFIFLICCKVIIFSLIPFHAIKQIKPI